MYLLNDKTTFAFSAENPTGIRNGGTRGKDCEKLRPMIMVEPRNEVTLCDVDGPGMISHMWFTGDVNHAFILRIYWENNAFPSVEAPLSAFLGCAYDENFTDCDGRFPYLNSALLLLAPGRAGIAYFEMPFRKNCKITIENRSDDKLGMYYMITGWKGAVPENISYFHATYHQEHPVTKGKSYTVLENVHGKGRFVGVTLSVGLNGHNTCWVEGEAKMYIDGETYPSINYTGTEDYFCGSYAFGNDIKIKKYQTYSGQYVGMFAITGDGQEQYNAQKRFMLYRWHVTDAIYFDKEFCMKMDNLGWTGPRYDDYTSVAYYYLDKPARPPFALLSNDELTMR